MFTAAIDTELVIDAPPDRVWAVLADFAAYPAWNPFIRSIEGRPVAGERLRNEMVNSPGASPMRFSPRVLVAEPGRELRWLGRLGIPGLFDGEHCFRLLPMPGARTHLRQSENFSGLLVPLLRGKLLTDTTAAFRAMNEALKARAEGAAA